MAKQEDLFKNVVSHAKEYGFIFPSSEVYDGLSAVYDYAQNGVELKKNIREYWWKSMVQMNENIVGLDAAILMHPTTWKASGHVDSFNDPMIDNKDSKKRYRADQLLEAKAEQYEAEGNPEKGKALLQEMARLLDAGEFLVTAFVTVRNYRECKNLIGQIQKILKLISRQIPNTNPISKSLIGLFAESK